jgi:hypothetical protein
MRIRPRAIKILRHLTICTLACLEFTGTTKPSAQLALTLPVHFRSERSGASPPTDSVHSCERGRKMLKRPVSVANWEPRGSQRLSHNDGIKSIYCIIEISSQSIPMSDFEILFGRLSPLPHANPCLIPSLTLHPRGSTSVLRGRL